MSIKAERLLKKLFMSIPSRLACADFSHRKGDFHSFLEPCPCVERYDKVMDMVAEYFRNKEKSK